jgi:phage terminase large subunit-like protein
LLPPLKRAAFLRSLNEDDIAVFEHGWKWWARPNQLPPAGAWRTWLLLAGRGFGKTRTGAEYVRDQVVNQGRRRVALVAPTAGDARDVMVEGESGILAIGLPQERPLYEPSKRRLTWPNGAIATTYSADEPERLRGPQHDAAWCDEIASWRYPEAWDMLMFGLRLGDDPRVVVTTTPELLLRRWQRVTAGDGQVVLLSGEPGIGKSRCASAWKASRTPACAISARRITKIARSIRLSRSSNAPPASRTTTTPRRGSTSSRP